MSEPDPVRKWLDSPAGTSLQATWPADTLSESFRSFYSAVMRFSRVSPPEALEAIRRIPRADRGRLTHVERVRLVRLRAHVHLGSGDARSATRDYRRAWTSFRGLGARRELGATGIGWVAARVQLSDYRGATRLAARVRRVLSGRDSLALARLDSNLGVLHLQNGRYGEAAQRFRHARRRFRAAGFENDAAFTTYNLGLSLLPMGRVREADRCFRDAEVRFRERGLANLSLHCRVHRGFVELLRGNVRESLDSLDGITRELEAAGDLRILALVERQQAEFLAAAGALERAERLAASALDRYASLGLQTDAAHSAFLHARILTALGRHMDARVRLEQARATWQRTGERSFHRRTTVELAAVLIEHGDGAGAMKLLRRVSRHLVRRDRFGAGVRCRHLEAQAALKLGVPSRALRLARAAYRDAHRLPTRLQRPGIALTIANALVRLDRAGEAVRWARRTVTGFESVGLSLGTHSMRGEVSAYQERFRSQVVETVLHTGLPRAARTALDLLVRARSPQLVEDLLTPSPPRRAALRTSIARLRDEALSPGSVGSEGSGEEAHRALSELEAELDRATLRPRGVIRSALDRRRLSSWVRRLEGRPLVHFDERGGEWGAFVVDERRSVRHVPLPDAGRALDEAWMDLRLLFEQTAQLPAPRRRRFLEATAGEAEAAMTELRRALWSPLDVDGRHPVLIPVGSLQGLPLESLASPDGDAASCATRWPHPAVLRAAPRRVHRHALMVHDATAPRRREARALGRLLRRRDFRVRTSSRRGALAASGELGILHFAAHGRLHRLRWMLNGIRLGDGWLGFEELRDTRIRNALVFFGSCESGLSTDLPGSETDGWLSAALGAGAAEVVVTLWKVDDETASAFASAFYTHRARGVAAAEAAARARREVRETLPHPYAWAPFAVCG